MYKKIIWATLSFFVFVGCERRAPETAKIIIELPKLDISKSERKVGVLTSGPAPVAWSEFDCFGFMVNGPELALSQNTCLLNDGLTGVRVSSFKFGPVFAGFNFN